MVKGSGFGVQGLGISVEALVWVSIVPGVQLPLQMFWAQQRLELRVLDIGFRVQDLRLRVANLGFRVWNLGFRIQDLGFQV